MPEENEIVDRKVTAIKSTDFRVGDIILDRIAPGNETWGVKLIGFVQSLVSQRRGHYDTTHAAVVTGVNGNQVAITHVVNTGVETFTLDSDKVANFFVMRANNDFMQMSIANAARDMAKDTNLTWSLKAALKAFYNGIRNKKLSNEPDQDPKQVSPSAKTICSQFVVDAIKKGVYDAKALHKKVEEKSQEMSDGKAKGFLASFDDDEMEEPVNKNQFDADQDALMGNNNESNKSPPEKRAKISDFSLNIPSHSLPKVLEATLYKDKNFSMMCYTGNKSVYDLLREVILNQIERLKESPSAKAQAKGEMLEREYNKMQQEIKREPKFSVGKNENIYKNDVDKATRLYIGMKDHLRLNTGLGVREAESYREVKNAASRFIPKLR